MSKRVGFWINIPECSCHETLILDSLDTPKIYSIKTNLPKIYNEKTNLDIYKVLG